MKPRFSLVALRELSRIIDYLDERNSQGELRVRAAILDAIEMLERFPRAGRKQTRNVRKLVVNRYPYLIYYSLDERTDQVVIARIRHAARKRPFRDA